MSKHQFGATRPQNGVAPEAGKTQKRHFAKFQELPTPTGKLPFRLNLKDIVSDAVYSQIKKSKKLIFHSCGDTGGVKDPNPQQIVTDHMEKQFDTSNTKNNPAFFYHLGDVIYFFGERENYGDQFYEPYMHYPAPIFAIPGNHDGDVDDGSATPSLQAFVKFFCSKNPVTPTEAGDAPRTTMTQPNVYWTLITPVANIIGLYTNAPDHGVIRTPQDEWFIEELKNAATERKKDGKAIIVALHHPPYSVDTHHGASTAMQSFLKKSFAAANVLPDMILCAHVHNFQRFTKTEKSGEETPYVLSGAGGYHNLHKVDHSTAGGYDTITPTNTPFDGVVLENYCDDHFGFSKITVDLKKKKITGEQFLVPRVTESWRKKEELYDYYEVDLKNHKVKNGKVNSHK
jgi:metallophosphoesterase superfamily enzyme